MFHGCDDSSSWATSEAAPFKLYRAVIFNLFKGQVNMQINCSSNLVKGFLAISLNTELCVTKCLGLSRTGYFGIEQVYDLYSSVN